jgi:hypothetical protein
VVVAVQRQIGGDPVAVRGGDGFEGGHTRHCTALRSSEPSRSVWRFRLSRLVLAGDLR